MNVSRRICINYELVKMMKPYMEKHNGNFGDAIREMIACAENYPPTNSSAYRRRGLIFKQYDSATLYTAKDAKNAKRRHQEAFGMRSP